MGNESKPVVVIPKEEAVFRLDKNGAWYHGDRRFENQKIIEYFHSMIKRDQNGYYLEQEHSEFIEKVYFPYEETALFVFRVIAEDGPVLVLNTGKKLKLEPEQLFLKNDHLYLRCGDEIVKFTEEAMFALADDMEEVDGRYLVRCGGKEYPIAQGD
ncbi:MAG: MFS transporter permease [Desulfobacterales bacterium]|nr:MFS transporter permease [Desulfobacterales bacterium]